MDARLLIICHACANPDSKCKGLCPCPSDGRDICQHGREAFCPLGKFDNIPDAIPQAPAPPIVAIPRKQWPDWAKRIADLATDDDAGVGDTVTRELGKGGEVFKATLKAMGIECGCDARRADWNQRYPFIPQVNGNDIWD